MFDMAGTNHNPNSREPKPPAGSVGASTPLGLIEKKALFPMTQSLNARPAGFKPGLVFLATFTFAMGSLGCYGWWQSDMDQITRLALAFGAGATALVIPFVVIALGRSWASAGVIPVLAVCMGMQAVSFHNFVGTIIEAPHKAAFDKGLEPLAAEVSRTTERLNVAQAAVDAFPALILPDCLCPKTTAAKTASWEAQRAPLSAAVETAKADRQNALDALATAQAAYRPMVPEMAVWLVGGLLDLSIALAIWSLEATARKIRKDHQREAKAEAARLERKAEKIRAARAERLAANRKAKAAADKKAAKARPTTPFVPKLVANDNR